MMRRYLFCLIALASTGLTTPAQVAVPGTIEIFSFYASGPQVQTGGQATSVHRKVHRQPNAASLRVVFGRCVLGDDDWIEIYSPATQERQKLGKTELARWRGTSGYFNGDTLWIDLHLMPGSTGSFEVYSYLVGLGGAVAGDTRAGRSSICGTDDRVATNDDRSGRFVANGTVISGGCTIWIASSDDCVVTAGHCLALGSLMVAEFACPPSLSNGALQHPPIADQFPIDQATITYSDSAIGDDWGLCKLFPNNLGQSASSRYGNYAIETTMPDLTDLVRVTGYGVDAGTQNQTNQTHAGPVSNKGQSTIGYAVDMKPGSSGSPIINESSGAVVGINTHGGCSSAPDSFNRGTMTSNAGFWTALVGLCNLPSAVPVANFTADASTVTVGGSVSFTDVSTGVPTSWSWDFNGDGQVDSTSSSPTFLFSNPGVHDVTITVGNSLGTDTVTRASAVVVAPIICGTLPFESLGAAVGAVGDLDGDGVIDFIVGAPGAQLGAGQATIFSGAGGGTPQVLTGDTSGDSLGASLSRVGDLNGDGTTDFIVGAPGPFVSSTVPGYARIYSGLDGSVLATHIGDSPGDAFGRAVSGGGDVDGDGVYDVVISAPLDDNNGADSGSALVLSGADGSIIHGVDGAGAGDQLGYSVALLGDLTGDGLAEFALGSPYHDGAASDIGRVVVLSGADGSLVHSFTGTATGEEFGVSCADAGDVDDDGISDLVIGASSPNTLGQTRVYSGATGVLIHVLDGLGLSVGAAGDVNGDGYADVLAGNFTADNNRGRAAVISGIDGELLREMFGNNNDDFLGLSTAGVGDLDGDGFADIVVGAPGVSGGLPLIGCVIVNTSPTLPVLHYSSALADDRLKLRWDPDGGDIHSVTGTLRCSAATIGGLGIYGVSFAPADSVIFGIPLLLAIDSLNLVESGNFGFDFSGELVIPGVTRQYPFIAGSLIHIQFFEEGPIISASNGVRMLMVP